MKTIALIGCGKSKLDHAAPARKLYTGALFQKSVAYAEAFCDEWAVLSAKHHVVMPDDVIKPYDVSLIDFDKDELRQWQTHANFEIMKRWSKNHRVPPGGSHSICDYERIVVLAGELYAVALESPRAIPAEYPLKGLQLGERLRWLNDALKKKAIA